MRDVVYALRGWRRYPLTSTVAVMAFALGIGATATVFSALSGILLQPLPYREPDRLVMLWQDRSGAGGPAREVVSPGLFIDWSTRADVVRDVAAVRSWFPNYTGGPDNGDPERLTGASVSGAYFDALGVAPALGRTLNRDDDRPGSPAVAVVSHRLWQRRLASDPAIVGRTAILNGQAVEIVGVMPESFRGAVIDADVWEPLRIDPVSAPRGLIFLRTIARLSPGVTLEQARAAFDALQEQLLREDPEIAGARARVARLHDETVGDVRPVLIVLAGGVGMVLLIACANVASILLARAIDRRAEVAVRMALGAGRGALIRQLLTESVVLAAAGLVVGVALAWGGVAMLASVVPRDVPRAEDIRLDVTVLVVAGAVALVSALVAGLAPVWSTLRGRVVGVRSGTREIAGHGRLRRWLVTGEVAVAMTLVVGAGLFVHSLVRLQRVDLGFRPDGLLVASIAPPRGAYAGPDAIRDLFDRVLTRASTVPGVDAVALTSILPLSGGDINFTFLIEGRPEPANPRDAPSASHRAVSANYFATMGMTVREGREFGGDDRAGGEGAVIVNETLAQRYWPGQSALGSRLLVAGQRMTVVGVVADLRHEGPATVPDAEMYVPYTQWPPRQATLVVRTQGEAALLGPPMRRMMREIDPMLPLGGVRPMAELVADRVARPRFVATVLSWFAGVAAALALLGVYGLLAFDVLQRTREIGVRIAMGASRGSVMTMVVRRSLGVVIAGIVVGVGAGAALSTVVRAQLFEVSPGDPATVALVAGLMLVAACLASVPPAWRAARVDPVVALRNE